MLLFSLIISFCQDHVIFLLIQLTGVLRHLFKFFSSYQVLHLFSTGVLSEFVLPCSLFISFQPEWFQFLLVHCTRHSQLCNLQGSHGVPCFYFLPQCSLLCSTPLCSFFQVLNLSRFFGFTLCRRSNLVLPPLLLFRFPPVPSQISGRDPLVVVECCNARDRRFRRFPYFRDQPCVSFVLALLFLHCIMSSCHHAI